MSLDFTLKMIDGISGPAEAADRSIRTLQKDVDTLNDRISKSKTLGDTGGSAKLEGELKKTEGAFTKLGSSAKGAATETGGLETMLVELLDPVTLIAVAAGAALAGITALGIGVFEIATRAAEATGEMNKMKSQLGALGAQSGKTGEELYEQFDKLSGTLPETNDELNEMAKSLLAAGVPASMLDAKLTALSTAKVMGLGTQFASLQTKIQAAAETGTGLKLAVADITAFAPELSDIAADMGLSVEALKKGLKEGTVSAGAFGLALDKAITKQGKPALDAANNSLTTIKAKIADSIGDLFELKPDEQKGLGAFASSLKDIGSLFDQNTASGKLIHTVIAKIADTAFSLAAKALPMVKHGFQSLEIAGLKIYIAGKPLIKQFGILADKLGIGSDNSDILQTSLDVLTGTIIIMNNGLTVVIASINMIIDGFQKATAYASGLSDAISKVPGVGSMASDALAPGSGGAISTALKSAGIKIPGFAEGGVVPGPTGQPLLAVVHGGETVTPVGGGGGVNITVAPGAVQIAGVGSSGEAIELTEEALSTVLERVVLGQGLGRAPA